MKKITLHLSGGRGYPVLVGASLSGLGRFLKKTARGRAVLVVSAAPVARRYARRLLAGLKSAGFAPHLALIPDGEKYKTLASVEKIYRAALTAGLDRRSTIVALGGGVVGDTAGFAAATYMRGIPFVQCPTTLLAMVDAAIGGKTAVDLPEGKNLVGAFWQPAFVWCDLSVLDSLPDRQLRTGMAEVIKYGIMVDPTLFRRLETLGLDDLRRDKKLRQYIVERSVAIKAGVVSRDERETKGERELLNLGHTFGHALETVTKYGIFSHGEAIAVGMAAAARLSHKLHILGGFEGIRIEQVLRGWGLPVYTDRRVSRERLLAAMARDKKNRAGQFRFIIPTKIGHCVAVDNPPPEALNKVLKEVGL